MPSLSQFIGSRRENWTRLERLLARSEGNGLRRLTVAELDALGSAYRHVVADLAVAQRDFPDDQLTASLNALAARAHLRLYRAPGGSWRQLGAFFTTGFARRLRAAGAYVLVAAALLLVPALWAYVAALVDTGMRQALVPAQLREIMEQGQTWTEIAAPLRPAMATLIFTNNIRVSFVAFAGGVFAGLGTVYVLVLNGVHLGAILGAAQHYGVGGALGGFVSPHGYLELTCIVIAGAAGLILGHAILRPGLLRRREALARAGRRALELVLGTTPVFILAGFVEGLVSPSALPAALKLTLGPLLWLAWLTLVLTIGWRSAGNHSRAGATSRERGRPARRRPRLTEGPSTMGKTSPRAT
ncbi:MAG: stage II sporulation protein M [Chloroflexota bacterium]